MSQVAENLQSLFNNAVALISFYVRYKSNTTVVVLISGVIKTLTGWQAALIHIQPLSYFFNGGVMFLPKFMYA